MKVYTYKSIDGHFETSFIEKFFADIERPTIHNYIIEKIEEDCLILVHANDMLHFTPVEIKEQIKLIKNKKIVLLYHHKNLGVPNYDQIEQLKAFRKMLDEMHFNEKQIYFISQLKGDIPLIKEYLGNIQATHFCKWMDEFKDNQILNYLKRFTGRNINIFPNPEYKRLSICIRRFEQDRLNFMSRLVDEEVIQNFNYSFTNHVGINCRDTISIDTIKNMLPEGLTNKDKVIDWVSNMPYKYGNDIEFPYPVELDSLIVNSFVNVAFETSPRNDTCVISEKVYKPIFLFKPFIVISQPYALKLLRDSGFLTFPDLIDESYDTILNYEDRIEAIIQEIKRIQTMDLRYIHEQMHNMHGMFLHNFNLLVNESFKPFPYEMTFKGIIND